MTGHPNLSPEINAAIAQSERDGGVFIKDVLPGGTVLVQTRNTLYTLVNHGDRWVAQGGKHLPEMTVVHVNGSTFGGSMIKVGFIGIGMHLELTRQHKGGLTTSPIQTISVRLPNGASVWESLAQIIFGDTDKEPAQKVVFALTYGVNVEHLAQETGLEPKRVQEIFDLLRFLEWTCAAREDHQFARPEEAE